MTDNPALITEIVRLRKGLMDIRRLKYVTSSDGEESLLGMAVMIADNVLELKKEV